MRRFSPQEAQVLDKIDLEPLFKLFSFFLVVLTVAETDARLPARGKRSRPVDLEDVMDRSIVSFRPDSV